MSHRFIARFKRLFNGLRFDVRFITQKIQSSILGASSEVETPVPIPNTVS